MMSTYYLISGEITFAVRVVSPPAPGVRAGFLQILMFHVEHCCVCNSCLGNYFLASGLFRLQ